MSATECIAVGKATIPDGSLDTSPFVANPENGVAQPASQSLKLKIKS